MAGMQELLRSLQAARERTDALFRLVRPDSFYERPIPERHRIIFYLGHLEAFDRNLFGGVTGSELDRLFAFGIDPPVGQTPQDQPSDWPTVAQTHEYNAQTRAGVDRDAPNVSEQYLQVAIEHRLMHAETFSYILHQLPYERKVNAEGPPRPAAAAMEPRMIAIPRGTVTLGLQTGEGFGWDNEFQAYATEVPAFLISKYKVTNGEYLEFVRQGAPAPEFWAEREGQWFWRGMFRELPLPLDWPVYCTHDQARTYAKWRGMKLPTEAQWQRAAFGAGDVPNGGNYDFRHWDQNPVTEGKPNGFGLMQMVGNGWEWTASVFAPFPGFQAFPFYPGYSANFFDGNHFVMKGASPRTAACFTRPSFRNWFRPNYPYVYAGFRLVEA